MRRFACGTVPGVTSYETAAVVLGLAVLFIHLYPGRTGTSFASRNVFKCWETAGGVIAN